MLALRDAVFQEWSKRLRNTVKEAEGLPQPILVDTLPVLYDHFVQAITTRRTGMVQEEENTVASEHGGERARLTDYNAKSVVSEYQLLRWTISDVLRVNGVQLNNDEFSIINAVIDDSIRESVNAFSLVQAALRERFVAALTHDLRTPLGSAHMAAELMELKADTPEMQGLARRVTTNLKRMDNMIKELLDNIVFQSGERLRLVLTKCNMLDIAREACRRLAASHGPRLHVAGESISGWWDQEALKRVIENIVGNAVKYGAPEAPIHVTVESYHGRMLLQVHNMGEPIPPDQLESVFQAFRRASNAREGALQGWGIGLPYVRTVAESHGGSVGINSAVECGTTVSFDIPLDARPYQSAPTLNG